MKKIVTQFRMIRYFLSFILFNIVFLSQSVAYDYLYINDPQDWWYWESGRIDEATITIHPRGVYTEIGLYLTISAIDEWLSEEDSLEIVLEFSLPENSILHDSWLWIDDSIVHAKIMDRWTASGIYEGIVKRRKDPSILTKNGNQDYELRIYPLPGNSSRTCKIAYLVPAQWSANSVYIPLPINIINTSYDIPDITLLTIETEDWSNPEIQGLDNISFHNYNDEFYMTSKRAQISASDIKEELNVKFDSPLESGIYLNSYKKVNEGVYQLAFLPSQKLTNESSNKICILFDYDITKSTYSDDDIIQILESTLLDNFSEKDSFNIIFSGLNPVFLSQDWIAGDSVTIESYFSSGINDLVSNYSNLPSILSEGIGFIETHYNNAEILIIANSDNLGKYNLANDLYDDLLSLFDTLPVIHIINFGNKNTNRYYQGGRYYDGNDYLYSILSKRTGGNYFGYFSDFFLNKTFTRIFQSFGGLINSFDLYTTLSDGFCFARYNLNNTNNLTYLNKPVVSIGKYHGSGTFNIQASGMFNNETFTINSVVEEGDIKDCDSIAERAWTGNYIEFLESSTQTNDIITEIIDFSLEYRVLSLYTAFLTIDPNMQIDGEDEPEVTTVKKSLNDNIKSIDIKAYPNPFTESITFNIELPESDDLGEITINIYNLYGQVVKSFTAADYYTDSKIEIVWDGTTKSGALITKGIYFMVVNTSGQTAKIKIVKM